ncbi:MAG: TetR/AcrR family transcriptional regulator [Candidatus Binatia bacterium]
MGRVREKTAAPASLSPRKSPIQRRAVETHGRILDATARLLDELGVDALTTNAIANRAGVNIATLYSYFPNKFAVVTALASRLSAQQEGLIERALADWDRDRGWGDGVDHVVDSLVEGMRRQPGAVAIRRAMQARADLREVDRASNRRIEKILAATLRRQGLHASAEVARVVCRCLVETATAMVDALVAEPVTKQGPLIEEWKRMHRSYLAHYLGEAEDQ